MRREWDRLGPHTDRGDFQPYSSYDVYAESMSKDGTYAGTAELGALIVDFDRRIRVFQDDILMDTFNPQGAESIDLLFEREALHYMCLKEVDHTRLPMPNKSSNVTPDDGLFAHPVPGLQPSQQQSNVHLQSDECDMFADCPPKSYPTYSAKKRPVQVKDPPERVDKRCSLALSTDIGNYYMWAGLYDGERGHGTRPVSLGSLDIECPDCGALFFEAERLCATRDVPAWCCGKTIKNYLSESARFKGIADPLIRDLYWGNSDAAMHFQTHIREYNHALSIAVPVTNYSSRNLRTGRVLSVNGRVTFECDATISADLRAGQLYFVDMTREVIDERMLRSEVTLRSHILEQLERYLRCHNDLVRTFELAGDIQRRNSTERVSLLINPHRDGFRVTDRDFLDSDSLARRPSGSNFVAAAYVGSRLRYNYDVVMYPRCGNSSNVPTQVIHEASPSLDTLLYPLIHLHAEDPWVEMRVSRQRVQRPRLHVNSTACGTTRDYYSSRIMIRRGEEGVLFQARSLCQQWFCDAAVKIIDNTLNYADQSNEELNVCQLDSLRRFVASEAASMGKNPGRVVIIPKNIQTSERAMYNNYMDSVRISMEYGSPAMMITFTTNPHWPEIVQQLSERGLEWDEYVNAPDIVVRVYLARLNVLMSDVINKGVFGRVLGYSGVHEFTSTMLPHFHMAVILDPADLPRTPDEVDALVSAEIPCQNSDPDGFYYVMKHMIHRPCDGSSPGYTNPLCRPNGVACTAGFPFQFRSYTVVTRRGPILRRRETEPVYSIKHRCMVDNRWVVPYNLKVGLRSGNHLNVMLSGENQAYKYLYGYFTKESRGQCVQGGMLRYFRQCSSENVIDWDEISHFRDLRVMGPYEAVFNILGVPVARLSHSVESMPIHLPDKQYVYYRGDAHRAAELGNTSKLEAWFNLNKDDPSARHLFYAEIVSSYRWSKGEWIPKSRIGNTLGRLMHVNPSPRNMELFFLRLLLLNRPEMTSFQDVLTVDGVTHRSFQGACQALGISDNESVEYDSAMEEVAAHAAPYQIRAFFATVVATCFISNAESLWKTHRIAMSNDFFLRGCTRREGIIRARRDVLRRIDVIRGDLPVFHQDSEADHDGSSCVIQDRAPLYLYVPINDTENESSAEECIPGDDEFLSDVPEINPDSASCCSRNGDAIRDEEKFTAHAQVYNDEQRVIHETVMQAVLSQTPSAENFFSLEVPAGCGKTFLYQGLLLDCKRRGIPTIACAMTALAALLLDSGDTCHRTFGIPIRGRQDGTDRSFIECMSPEAARLRDARLIVIDEMSMLARWQVTLIDHFLRDIMSLPNCVFGGKVVLLGGDMGQILPVLRHASSSELVANAIISWAYWCVRTRLVLKTNMRAHLDPEFAAWTMKVRDGSANVAATDDLKVPPRMPVSVPRGCRQDENQLQRLSRARTRDEYAHACALIEKVYGDMSFQELSSGIILSPTNDATRAVNNIVMEKIAGDSRTYLAKTSIIYQDRGQQHENQHGEFIMTAEELEAIHAANSPPHHLKLKVCSVVMMIINIDKRQGLCNGARFLVTKLLNHAIGLRRLNEGSDGPEIFVPRMKMRSDDVPVAGSIERFQFPVTPGFAVTINKSQGQTFENVGIFLRRPVFTHGQFYVAVGRAKRATAVHIVVVRGSLQGPSSGMRGGRNVLDNVRTKNIVYPQVLI